MEKINFYLAIIIGKLVFFILRLFKRGATAAPGLYASKIDPSILLKLSRQLKYSLLISGTNGKTTTARMISTVLDQAGRDYFHNRTGSNLERGIISELLKNFSLKGLPKNRLGLWEVDEAVFPLAVKKLNPKIIILTNLFRDQLDRYGEIDSLAKKWQKALKKLLPQTTVILNADDPQVASLGKNLNCQVVYFGLRDKSVGGQELAHTSDATICPYCLANLNYRTCFVSHLGIYHCSQCGPIQPQPTITAQQIKTIKNTSTQVKITTQKEKYLIKLKIPGVYNVYNLLAALAACSSLSLSSQTTTAGLNNFQPAFGRFEKIKLKKGKKEQSLRILLAKNPTGFNQVLKTINQLTKTTSFSCLIALNDQIADGRDVSWIWDVDFKNLKNLKNLNKLIISGLRAEDMALRIKYSDWRVNKKKWQVSSDLKKTVANLINQSDKNLFIIPTYTAMLTIRKILNKKGLVHSTWKD